MRSHWPAVLLIVLLVAGWGLREWQLGDRLAGAQAAVVHLQDRAAELQEDWETCRKARKASEAEVTGLRPQLQELRGQVSNLQAQRDHLRNQARERQSQVEELQDALTVARKERENALQQALEAEALPAQLRRERNQLLAQVDDLEQRLDTMASREAVGPAPLLWGGLSSDQQVFTLQDESADMATGPFPQPILLCQHHQTVAEGWIHRREETWLIGHAVRWHIDPSTLVNGEKLFIVQRNDE